MSGYTYGGTQQSAPILTVEQVKRRNAELNAELRALTMEGSRLDANAQAMRGALTTERRKLSRQIRELDAARAQAAQIAAAAAFVSTLPPPIHGGREGLQAATDEMAAHEYQSLKLSKTPRPLKGPSHGTRRKYDAGCRCDECRAWKKRATDRYRANRKHRREQEKAAA